MSEVIIDMREESLKKMGVMGVDLNGATPLIPYAIVQIHLDKGKEVEERARGLVKKIERDLLNKRGKNGIAFSDISVHCSRSQVVEYCTIAVLNPSSELVKEAPLITYWSM